MAGACEPGRFVPRCDATSFTRPRVLQTSHDPFTLIIASDTQFPWGTEPCPGTPEECVAHIKEIQSAGVNHMILCITDPAVLKAFTGKDVDVPDVQGQLQLIADEVMPAFA